MAGCLGFSLADIRILLERNQIAFKMSPASEHEASKNAVTRAAAKAGPSIVAMVDRFSELPKELQDHLTKPASVPNTSADHVKSFIIGGKQR
jgi:hypothetical protein